MNNQIKDSIQELEYIESRLKLANEAVELIHEFEEIVSEIGISIMREVSINEEKLTIKAIDPNDNDLELELYEVATVYRSIIDGCGPCGGIFEEEIDFRIDDIEDDYKNKSKEEFLNYDEIEKYMDFGGIRMERDILIQEDGRSRILGNKFPRTADEIEEYIEEYRK